MPKSKTSFLAFLNQMLNKANLRLFAKLCAAHTLNEARINYKGNRQEIFMSLKRLPLEILEEVYEQNFETDECDDFEGDDTEEESEQEEE